MALGKRESEGGVMVIWKYELKLIEKQLVSMPAGANIIHVAAQFEKPCIWAIVDPHAEKVERVIGIIGTGAAHFDATVSRHLGSFFLQGGAFVGHVFEAAMLGKADALAKKE